MDVDYGKMPDNVLQTVPNYHLYRVQVKNTIVWVISQNPKDALDRAIDKILQETRKSLELVAAEDAHIQRMEGHIHTSVDSEHYEHIETLCDICDSMEGVYQSYFYKKE